MSDNFALSFENLCASTKSPKLKALLFNVNGYVEKGGITAGTQHLFILYITSNITYFLLMCLNFTSNGSISSW